MKIRINKAAKIATGESVNGIIVLLQNSFIDAANAKVTADIQAWTSETNFDNNMAYTYLYKESQSKVYSNFTKEIPQADLDQCISDGNFGVIGTNYPDYIKEAIADITNLNVADIEILELI